MRKGILIGTFVFLSLTATNAGLAKEEFNRITTKSAFEKAVVGKRILFEESKATSFTVNRNGTWKGVWNGSTIGGTWKFVDGAWCRARRGSGEDCQIWTMNPKGSVFRVTRDRGKGKSFTYTIGN
jgi:hypothetical protein